MRGWVAAAALLAGLVAVALVLPPARATSARGPMGWLVGVVADYATGDPVAGATVGRAGGPERARTAADGTFLLVLPAGVHRLVVQAPGYVGEEETQASVPPGGVSEQTFALLPEAPGPVVEARIAERWFAGERVAAARPAADTLSAAERSISGPEPGDEAWPPLRLLGSTSQAAARTHRSLLPFVQRGCDQPATASPATPTVRVLMPNGCVVTMDLEEYVKGVVPAEVPPVWPTEVLKAQAIAARTYALSRPGTLRGGAQVDTTTLTQVYTTRRYTTTTAAVEATRGQVVTHQGKPAATFFFADSGGATEANENVWGGPPYPYLRGVDERALVPTICGQAPTLCWSVSLSETALRSRLAISGTIQAAAISQTYPSGRLKMLQVTTATRQVYTQTLLADRWRDVLGTPSAVIKALSRRPDGSFTIEGQGWGHGLGMPQWGAWARAKQGQTAEQILRTYYAGTAVSALPPPLARR